MAFWSLIGFSWCLCFSCIFPPSLPACVQHFFTCIVLHYSRTHHLISELVLVSFFAWITWIVTNAWRNFMSVAPVEICLLWKMMCSILILPPCIKTSTNVALCHRFFSLSLCTEFVSSQSVARICFDGIRIRFLLFALPLFFVIGEVYDLISWCMCNPPLLVLMTQSLLRLVKI